METQIYPVYADGYKRIPELFEGKDFELMINAIDKAGYYPHDAFWRTWLMARDKCILSILYYMGLRPKEACSLRFDDFNAKKITLFIRGENNKQKTDREMPIPKEVYPFLESYLKWGRRSNFLFPSYKNMSKPLSSQSWKLIMREKILKQAGLYITPSGRNMPRTRSYSLRASFAVRLLKTSKSPDLVQLMLGHKDWRSLRHYLKLAMMSDKDTLEKARALM